MDAKKPHDNKITINRKIVWREVDGEAVILNVDSSNYFTLNETGTHIWKMLKSGNTVSGITAAMSKEYGVSESRVRNDVNKLITSLKNEKIVDVI